MHCLKDSQLSSTAFEAIYNIFMWHPDPDITHLMSQACQLMSTDKSAATSILDRVIQLQPNYYEVPTTSFCLRCVAMCGPCCKLHESTVKLCSSTYSAVCTEACERRKLASSTQRVVEDMSNRVSMLCRLGTSVQRCCTFRKALKTVSRTVTWRCSSSQTTFLLCLGWGCATLLWAKVIKHVTGCSNPSRCIHTWSRYRCM